MNEARFILHEDVGCFYDNPELTKPAILISIFVLRWLYIFHLKPFYGVFTELYANSSIFLLSGFDKVLLGVFHFLPTD